MKPEMIEQKIKIPSGVEIFIDGGVLRAKGPLGEAEKKLQHPKVNIKVAEEAISISTKKPSRREKKIVGTFTAHAKNLIKGVTEGFVYKMKICSGHFPINVGISGDELQVKNFFGEKIPRVLKIKKGAKVKIEGEIITIESTDKEIAGQIAADIEMLTKRVGFDRRIFQDGIYITEKAGKGI